MKFHDLTDEQQKFAKTQNKHIIALASAGAGKTQTLVFFIQDKILSGVKPNEIVSFSFTRKAANELKERVKKFFKKNNYDFKYISTIHAFCWNEIIKPFHREIGYTTIPTITYEFPEEFMNQEYKSYGRKMEKNAFNKKFARIITKDLQKENFKEPETARLLQYLVNHNLVMFDFMIHLSNFILDEPEYKEQVKKSLGNIKYIITDEAQDLNPAQYKFTKLLHTLFLTNNHDIYLIKVGDFKQSIYGFRGSNPKIINQFIEEFNPSIEIMSYNFRSAPKIVELSNEIAKTIDLGNDKLNKSKISKAAGNNIKQGEVYNIYDVEEFLDELKLIEDPLHETCILARTNQIIKQIARILGKLNIPYYLHTEYDILKRTEVKLFMNMLSIVSHGYNKSLMLDIIKAAKGGIPLRVASSISKCDSISMVEKMFKDIKKIPELCEIYYNLEQSQFHLAISKIAKLLEKPKKSEDFIKQSLERFYRDLNEIKIREGLDSWMEALEEMLFEAQFLEQKQTGKVQIMTVHKAKGLQWKNVIFIYDFSLLEQVENDFYDLEEEKRVVYTAVTRPKENLCIWDLSSSEISELFYQGKLEKMIDLGLRKKFLNLEEFRKY